MNRGKTGKFTTWLGYAVGLTALLVVLVVGLRCRQADDSQDPWATVSDDDATAVAQRLAELGSAGIEPLVLGMASDRAGVVEAARRALCREVNRWERLPSGDASARLNTLVESLASQSERFSAPARATAAELAMRVLLWPTDGAVVERRRLVAACTQVLKASSVSSKSDAIAHAATPRRAARRRGLVALVSFEEPSRSVARAASKLAGRPFPSGLVEPPPLEREPSGHGALLAGNDAPRRLVPDPAARRLPAMERPVEIAAEAETRADGAVVVAAGQDDRGDDSSLVPAVPIDGRAGDSRTP